MSTPSILFDAPGPKARRRHAIITVIVGLVAVAVIVWVLMKLGDKGNLTAAKWSPFLRADTWTEYLLQGIVGTLKAAAISIILAGILGLALGMGRLSEHRALRWVSSVFVEFFRAVPVLIMMIFSFGLYAFYETFPPEQLALAGVVTGLTLYNLSERCVAVPPAFLLDSADREGARRSLQRNVLDCRTFKSVSPAIDKRLALVLQ